MPHMPVPWIRSAALRYALSASTVLPAAAAVQLIDAREKSFWVAKANHADDIFAVMLAKENSQAWHHDLLAIPSLHPKPHFALSRDG